MNTKQYEIFCEFRSEFKSKIAEWSRFNEELRPLQEQAYKKAGVPDYSVETPVVYNTALDQIQKDDDIKLIVIGDNPGKNEQLSVNQKYLVGQAGKIGDGFFKKHPEFDVDFRKNVIILNKTPVHSAKTNQLKYISKNASPELNRMLSESELWMASRTAKLHQDLLAACNVHTPEENLKRQKDSGDLVQPSPSASDIDFIQFPQIWLVGYAELKGRGLFIPYRDELKKSYSGSNADYWNQVFVFQHFSMNRFTIDLSEFMNKQKKTDLKSALYELGKLHRTEIFC